MPPAKCRLDCASLWQVAQADLSKIWSDLRHASATIESGRQNDPVRRSGRSSFARSSLLYMCGNVWKMYRTCIYQYIDHLPLLMRLVAVLADPEPVLARLVRGCIAMAFTASVPALLIPSTQGRPATLAIWHWRCNARATHTDRY